MQKRIRLHVRCKIVGGVYVEEDIAEVERGRASRAASERKLLRPLDEHTCGKRHEQDQEQGGKQAARPAGIEPGQVEA